MFDVGCSMFAFSFRSKLEYLQPIISRIHSHDAISLIDGHAPRISELPRLVSAGAPHLDPAAGRLVDQLHAVVSELAHDQMSFRVLVETVRITKLAEPGTHAAHRA